MKKVIYFFACLCTCMWLVSCEKDTGTSSGVQKQRIDFWNTDDLVVGTGTGWLETEDSGAIPNDISFSTGNLPSSVDLTPYMPPVGNQGETGTCVAWASAYYLRTGLQAIRNNIATADLAQTKWQFSPKDLFWSIPNNLKGPDCMGTYFEYAFDRMQSRGVATMKTVPFTDVGDCSLQPATAWTQEAADYRIQSYRDLPLDLNTMKTKLAEDRPLVFGAMVTKTFGEWRGNGVMRESDVLNSTVTGGHAMTIVGYDDAKNAFRIVNSWGKIWGDNGYAWVDYNLMVNNAFVKYVFVAYDAASTTPPNPGSATDMNVAVPALWDEDDETKPDPTYRKIIFDIANFGSQPLLASDRWDVLYLYFNAADANDFGVLLHERFTDEFGGQGQYGPFNGLGISYSEWSNIDIPADKGWAQVGWNTPYVHWPYRTPPITGYYYLVMIADASDVYDETNEGDNFFYITNELGGPIRFQNGVAQGLQSGTLEERTAATPVHTLVRPGNLNAYGNEEIGSMIRELRAAGKIPARSVVGSPAHGGVR